MRTEVGNRADDIGEIVAAIGIAHVGIEAMNLMQDITFQRRHVVVFDSFGIIVTLERAQQIAHGIAQFAIGIDRGLDDLLADAQVFGIVRQGHPQTQDFNARFLGDVLRGNDVALGLRHLLALFIKDETVCQDGVIGRAATRAATL